MNKEIRILRIYGFVLFMGVGTFFPYIFLYMRQLGFSNSQIGILGALGPMVMMVAQPIWGWASDHTGQPERVSLGLALGMAISLGLLLSGQSFFSVIIYLILFNIFYSSLIPTYDSIVMGVLDQQKRISYGQVRWLGSLGFAITAFLIGRIIEMTHISIVLWVYIVLTLLLAFLAIRLPKVRVMNLLRQKIQIWPLLKNREFVIFLLVSALVIGSNAINYTFFSFLFTELGGGEGLLGIAMLIAAFAEIPFFFFSAKLQKRFPLPYLLVIAYAVTGLRWFLNSLASSPYQIMAFQLLHGITYGLLYSSSVVYVSKLTPVYLRASGQNLFWAVTFGFGNVVANLIGGWVYEYHSVQTLFALAGITAFLGTLIFLFCIPRTDHRCL